MDVYPVDWQADDVDGQYTITLFGRTPSSKVVAVHIKYFPFFFVGMPPGCPHMKTQEFVKEAVKKHGALQEYSGHTERVSMWGFTNSTKVPMAVLGFPTLKKMRIAAAAMRGKGLVTYESSIDPLLRFFHVRDISPSQWVTVAAATHAPTPSTRAAIELNTVFNRVGPSTLTQRPPLTICSWDLETYSLSRKFPQAHNASDAIIQIACSFQRYGEPEPYRRLVMCLKETAPVEGVEIRWFDDEATMINAWMHELAVEQPDLMVGYNTNGFDWPYLYGRYLVLVEDSTGTPHVILGLLGRMQQGGGELQQHTFSSNAHGENTSTTLAIPGMLNLDLMQLMRREFQLADYSLDAVAKKYLGDSKIDLAAGEIFDKYEGSPTDRALVAEYAIKDTLLPLRLLDKLCILSNLTEMAGAAFVPVSFVLTKGQQIKVYSLMMKNARQLGFACPDKKGIGVKGKYTGATVLSAMKGFHTDIVSCLDFASRECAPACPPTRLCLCCLVRPCLMGACLVVCVVQCTPASSALGTWTTPPLSLSLGLMTCRASSTSRWRPTRAPSALHRACRACCPACWPTLPSFARLPRRRWRLRRRARTSSWESCTTQSRRPSRSS